MLPLLVHRRLADILAQMDEINRVWDSRIGQPVELHTGVNTGIVVAGEIGAGLDGAYAVTGDTTNLASRLQSLLERGRSWSD